MAIWKKSPQMGMACRCPDAGERRKNWCRTAGWRSPCAGLSGGVEIFAAEHGAAAVCAA